MMYPGNSQYSRPTTAKKSPISPKQKQIKQITEPQERQQIDADKLIELISYTITKQKQCEKQGRYVQAEGYKRKVKQLKQNLQDQQMIEMRNRHENNLKQLEAAHLEEMNIFNLQWDKRINQFNKQIDVLLGQMSNRHEKQINQKEQQIQNEHIKKFHQSPKLLELRKIEHQLGKQQNYVQANIVQVKANKLQKDQIEKYKKVVRQKNKNSIILLRNKQQAELQALRQRIQLQVEERQRQRKRKQFELIQKYENILKQTQFQQNIELTKKKKDVVLSQFHKKSKVVGKFSYSKDR